MFYCTGQWSFQNFNLKLDYWHITVMNSYPPLPDQDKVDNLHYVLSPLEQALKCWTRAEVTVNNKYTFLIKLCIDDNYLKKFKLQSKK
jgi:hypothetical protein